MRCDDGAVVSVGAVNVTNGAWRVTPGGVDDRIDVLRVHRSDHRIQILGAARVTRDVYAGWFLGLWGSVLAHSPLHCPRALGKKLVLVWDKKTKNLAMILIKYVNETNSQSLF